jgi:D-arabinose 1-dehydrogenase-like Zn-dependent alcohol dehydrogenase
MAFSALPKTMRALVQEEKNGPLVLKEVPTPEPGPGSVVVKILANLLQHQTPGILAGQTGFTYPTPFITGGRAVGRVAATGPDTTSLEVGQLVLLEPFIRARDNPDIWIMWGAMDGASAGSKKLFAGNWRYATFADYAKAPLEVTWALNENRLCTELGYTIPDLMQLAVDVVAYSGLKGINLKPGERIIVTPATGMFSGAAVGVAVAMGATVLATGRNEHALARLVSAHPTLVSSIPRTSDVETDTANLQRHGAVDAFLEMTPMGAEGSTHVRAAFGALKQYGRACIMGMGAGAMKDVEIPTMQLTYRSITVHGHAMYQGEDVRELIRMAEAGVLKLGKQRGFDAVTVFKLEDFGKGFDWVSENHELGQMAVLVP